MPAGQILTFIDSVPSPWNMVIKTLLIIGGGVYLFMKTFKYVPEGHEGLRLRFQVVVQRDGKPVVLRKGLHIMFPFVHNIQTVNVLDRTVNLRAVTLPADEFRVYGVRATVVFKVADIYKLSYAAEEPMPRLKAACEDALRGALLAHPLQDGTLGTGKIAEVFSALVLEEAEELGVTFRRLNIQDVKPDSGMAVAGAISSLGPSAVTALEKLGITPASINGKSTQ